MWGQREGKINTRERVKLNYGKFIISRVLTVHYNIQVIKCRLFFILHEFSIIQNQNRLNYSHVRKRRGEVVTASSRVNWRFRCLIYLPNITFGQKS